MNPFLKRKDGNNDNLPLVKFHRMQSQICALTEDEFLEKSKVNFKALLESSSTKLDQKINKDLKVDDWRKILDNIPDFKTISYNIEFYTNYNELLTESLYYYEQVSKRAYKMGLGRLHRSAARTSITLSINAAEDYINFLCEESNKSNKVKKSSFMNKWKEFIPNIENEYPFLKIGYDIRNESIIHFKSKEDLNLKHIIDLNFKNAEKLQNEVGALIDFCNSNFRQTALDSDDILPVNIYVDYLFDYISLNASILNEINPAIVDEIFKEIKKRINIESPN